MESRLDFCADCYALSAETYLFLIGCGLVTFFMVGIAFVQYPGTTAQDGGAPTENISAPPSSRHDSGGKDG